jgi:hypothetical protein
MDEAKSNKKHVLKQAANHFGSDWNPPSARFPKARIVKAAQELIDSNPERSWIPLSQMLVDLIGAPGVLNKSYTAGRGNWQLSG